MLQVAVIFLLAPAIGGLLTEQIQPAGGCEPQHIYQHATYGSYTYRALARIRSSSWQTKAKVLDISPDYCVFPFKYKDHWYYSCTSVDSKHKRMWCSLTTDFDQDHLWGHCLGNINFWVTMTESSCIFPFTAGGKTYDHCTTDYWFPGIPWCSTTANYDEDKKWAYCPSSGVRVSSIKTG